LEHELREGGKDTQRKSKKKYRGRILIKVRRALQRFLGALRGREEPGGTAGVRDFHSGFVAAKSGLCCGEKVCVNIASEIGLLKGKIRPQGRKFRLRTTKEDRKG